jgi:hypothetical protein
VGGLAQKKQRTTAWAVSPNHGIVFDNMWEIINDLEILIKRLKAKQAKVSMVVPSSEMEGRRWRAEGGEAWRRKGRRRTAAAQGFSS